MKRLALLMLLAAIPAVAQDVVGSDRQKPMPIKPPVCQPNTPAGDVCTMPQVGVMTLVARDGNAQDIRFAALLIGPPNVGDYTDMQAATIAVAVEYRSASNPFAPIERATGWAQYSHPWQGVAFWRLF